jgi:prepilin-type N-terminal cleavage/methylation domain-containing protein
MGEEMRIDNIRGFTLTELLVSMAIFSVIIILIYPTFSFIDQQSKIISDKQALQERGQRILNYIVSDLATAGFIVGSTQDVPYCSQTGVKVIQHSDGEPYDTLTFITSKPVEIKINQNCITPGSTQPCVNNDYYLNVCQDASAGAIQITVDASLSCVKGIEPALNVSDNGRALIAFERASQINHAYTVSDYTVGGLGYTITLFSSLNLDIPQDSLVYTVRQYRYMVDDPQDPNATYPRTLRRVSWTKNCDEDPINIDEASGENGGVDALQFQYVYNHPITGAQIIDNTPPSEIKDLRAIRVIILIRSDGPERDYTDDNIYDLDGTLTAPLEFNDHYRRIELSKTVEVKSIAF